MKGWTERGQQFLGTVVSHFADEPERDVEIGGGNPSGVDAPLELNPQRFGDGRRPFADVLVQLDADEKSQVVSLPSQGGSHMIRREASFLPCRARPVLPGT